MNRALPPLLALAWLPASVTDAHHSISADYHRDQSITVQGTVTAFVFRNPHAFIHVDVANDGDATDSWALEWDDVEDLTEEGYTSETLKPGDEIVVTGNPARDGTRSVFIRALRRPADGLEYARSSGRRR